MSSAEAGPPGRGGPPRLSSVILDLFIGSIGGAIAWLLGLPLAWMIGAMIATTAASVAGLPLAFSRPLRTGMIIVLGVMLGSAFVPEILGQMARWAFSLAALAVYAVLTTALTMLYFRRFSGYDGVTAYFCAVPGGLNEMTMLGGALGGDERTISLTHGARILFTVLTIPIGFRFLDSYDPAARAAANQALAATDPLDFLLLALCGIVGFFIAKKLRLPAASVLGPMVLSAAAHLTGWTEGRPPAELVAAAQVVAGSAIGARFAGTAARRVLQTAAIALGATVIMIAVAALFAVALNAALDLPLPGLILALAPGGLAEMSLVALALHVEAAFVSTHHVVRIVMVVLVAPVLYRAVPIRWRKGAPGPAAAD